MKRTLQPRDISPRKGGVAEPLMSRRRQQTASRTGARQDARGVERRACGHSSVRNRRGPSRRPTSGVGGPYKPKVKWGRAGRESEGLIVLLTPSESSEEGRGPALVAPVSGGKREGMVVRPNHPIDKARELHHRLYVSAKRHWTRRFHALRSGGVTTCWRRDKGQLT